MKKSSLLAIAIILFLAGSFSCSYHANPHTGSLPPGQAKKVTGSQSAKPYAPGQQKKH